MGDAFRALADPTRREILRLLGQQDLTAGEIANHFDMTKPSISHHLNILKSAGLIDDERQGQFIRYSLNTTVLEQVVQWFYDLSGKGKGREADTAEPQERRSGHE